MKHLFTLLMISMGISGYGQMRVWIPHVASSEVWTTSLVVDNLSNEKTSFSLTTVLSDGSESTETFQITNHAQNTVPLLKGESGWVDYDDPDLVFRSLYKPTKGDGMAEFLLSGRAFNQIHFPMVGQSFDRLDWQGITVMNIFPQTAIVTIVGLSEDGEVIGTTQRTIEPFQRWVGLSTDLFPEILDQEIDRIIVESEYPLTGITIAGLDNTDVLLFSPALGRFDQGKLAIPHIADDTQNWSTTLSIHNTNELAQTVNLDLHDQSGAHIQKIQVEPFSSTYMPITEAHSGVLQSSEDGIFARLHFEHVEGGAASFNLSQLRSKNLAYVLPNHSSSALTWTGLAIKNVSEIHAELNVSGVTDHQSETTKLDLDSSQKWVGTTSTLFQEIHPNHIQVQSNQELAGLDIAGFQGSRLLFTPAVDNSPSKEGVEIDGLYFPSSSNLWETQNPQTVGWDSTKLQQAGELARDNGSSGLCITYQGRIMYENYWFPPNIARKGLNELNQPIEDVASVQKSVTSVLVAFARDKGFLDVEQPVSHYLGTGWTLANTEQEKAITVRHLITMTTGLSEALEYRHPAGTNWSYNTPVYAKTHDVLESATQMNMSQLTRLWLTGPLKMDDSFWKDRPVGAKNDRGFNTCVRDMARVGLLMLGRGYWQGENLFENNGFLHESVQPSTELKGTYGFLWWLNTNGNLIQQAPHDLISAQGSKDRRIWIVPSMDLVISRTGAPTQSGFFNAFWTLIDEAAPSQN